MKVPFFSLDRQHKTLKNDILKNISEVIDSGQFTDGKFTREFQEKWAELNGVKHCLLTSSGTSALEILLKAFGAKNEVYTTANSFMASASCISSVGAWPHFLDTGIDCNLNFNRLHGALDSGYNLLALVLFVSLYGKCIEFERFDQLKEYYPTFLGDLSQAAGCEYEGKPYATYFEASAMSLYTTKTIGIGEAGCVLTNDDSVAEDIKSLRNHGRTQQAYEHDKIGTNARLTEFSSAAFVAKLPYYLDFIIPNKMRILERYYKNLSGIDNIKLLKRNPNEKWVPYLVPFFTSNPQEVISKMAAQGVEVGRHYPIPLPFQPAYKNLKPKKQHFPNTVEQCNTQVSLPTWPEISDEELDYVCEKLIEAVK